MRLFSFGQVKVENKQSNQGIATGDYKPNRQETPKKSPAYGDGTTYHNACYNNFEFTVKNYGYNKDGDFYSWGIKVKNNYSSAAQLEYKLIVGDDVPKYGTLTYYIQPGEIYANDMGTALALIVHNNSENYRIEVSKVCFEGQDCIKNGYVDCNGQQMGNSITTNKIKINSSDNTESNVDADKVNNEASLSDLFDRTSSYQNQRNKIKEILISAGFKFVSFEGDNSAKYIFKEFTFTYSPKFSAPYYIRSLSFRDIKSYDVYEKLYQLVGCEQASDGRKCTKFQDILYGWWFDVSID